MSAPPHRRLSQSVAFVGAGAMASAIVGGLLRCGTVTAEQIVLVDPSEDARLRAEAAFKGTRVASTDPSASLELLANCDIMVICVKPQVAVEVLATVVAPAVAQRASSRRKPVLLISVMAGVPIDTIERVLAATVSGLSSASSHRIVRTMPNTPMMVGAGACGYVLGPGAQSGEEELLTTTLFSPMSLCVRVASESQLNAVTGLSGSGPAFVAAFIEALADGGVYSGLPRDVSNKLALQTVAGTAQLLSVDPNFKRSGSTLALKEAVSSPGGTTIHGILALEESGLRAATAKAVIAASMRSEALSKL